MAKNQSSGYVNLLKNNSAFRNLWFGQIASELGDWLNSIAIYALILKVTGSGISMAVAMMAKLLPMVVVSPIAGVVIDRVNRKNVMILMDTTRFLVVLCFLLVDGPEDFWLLYFLIVVEVSLAGFFEPARSAIIPSLVKREDLVTANALSGSTWSVMLSFGAAIGGVVVALLGIRAAFIIDAVSFLLSGWFISRIPILTLTKKTNLHKDIKVSGFRDLFDGIRYLISEPLILAVALLKSGLAIGGGIMTLIPLYSYQFKNSAAAVSIGIGIMYSSRGIGAAIGPILVKKIFGDSTRVLQNSITVAFFLGAIAYYLFSQSHSLLFASLSIGFVTMCGSVVWVYSSALIHLEADKNYLGRIFSAEMAFLTLVMAVSNLGVGWSTDQMGFSPHEAAFGIAILFLIPGCIWTVILFFVRQRFKQGRFVGSTDLIDPSGFNPAPTRTLDED